jgi:hypothetical protein
MSKLQTHPLIRENASHQETRNCQTGNKNLVTAPATPRQTGQLTVSRINFNFKVEVQVVVV